MRTGILGGSIGTLFPVLGLILGSVSMVVMLSACSNEYPLGATGGVPAASAQEGSTPDDFESIPDDVQLIAKLDTELPFGVQEMVVWPSSEYIDEHYATDDISDQLPPVYPENAVEDAKPIVPGGMSPAAAVEEAEWWFRETLKEEWIPPDLEEWLIPVRAEVPQQSMVIGRYTTQGNAIQVSQTRWAITVVVTPESEGDITKAEEFGEDVFQQFFTRGEEMSLLERQRVSDPGEPLQTFLLDETSLPGPDALENWWGSTAWYTDGRSTAVFLHKRIAGEQHTATPEDPWF